MGREWVRTGVKVWNMVVQVPEHVRRMDPGGGGHIGMKVWNGSVHVPEHISRTDPGFGGGHEYFSVKKLQASFSRGLPSAPWHGSLCAHQLSMVLHLASVWRWPPCRF